MAYKCKNCGKFVAKDAAVCKHCGQENPAEYVEQSTNTKRQKANQNIFYLNQENNSCMIECPNCGSQLTLPEKFRKDYYLHCNICQRDFANPLNPVGKSENWLKKKGSKWGCLIIVIIIVIAAIFAPKDVSTGNVGDEIVITANIYGAIDEAAFSELSDAILAQDQRGVSELIFYDRIRAINKGTEGKVIKRKIGKARIRFNDGQAFWVISEKIAPKK